MRPDRASPRGHRPPRSRVPRSPGNDRAPLRLPVVATAAAVVAAAAAAWEGGCGPPGSASLPAPGRAGQRRLRLLLRLLPALPRLMPGPGCRSPGATRAPLRACALMARRGRRSALMRRGSHRSPSRACTRVTPTTAGFRRVSTCAPGSRHLRPQAPRAPGLAGPPIPRVSPPPPRNRPPAPAEPHTRTPARTLPPPTAPRRPLTPRVPAAAAAVAAAAGPAPSSLAYPAGGRALQSRGGGSGGSLP